MTPSLFLRKRQRISCHCEATKMLSSAVPTGGLDAWSPVGALAPGWALSVPEDEALLP